MRYTAIVVGAGVALFAGAACANPEVGSQQPIDPPGASAPAEPGVPAPPAPPAPPGTSDGQKPAPPAGGTAVPGDRIDSEALPEGYPVEVSTTGQPATLQVVAEEGGCGRASAEVVEQSAERVVIKLVETEPSGGVACTMDIRYPKLSVQLQQPLGDREIVLQSEKRKQ
ncbi:hypothetical protein [Amycolatopsis suaedae]|uniref:Uncharacterized protein n=1 Tax=Amycolatopsis suaedae TaxID=2510978 RepID=A0A4Q7J7F1_9PSEU|nr:hypothetical protein [Amycolatopsis suaedae]RZQ63107.1 hypothetical protein EWH70_15600 [Amycolatopsis suaedae]